MRVGTFKNETVTLHKGTIVGKEINHIETQDLKSESFCQNNEIAIEVTYPNSDIPEYLAYLLISSDCVTKVKIQGFTS